MRLDKKNTQRLIDNLPSDVVDCMKNFPVVVAGGFCRSIMQNTPVKDIDCFLLRKDISFGGIDFCLSPICEHDLVIKYFYDYTYFSTDNAITLRKKYYKSYEYHDICVQFITRWKFCSVQEILNSFDYTNSQCALWFDPLAQEFVAECTEDFIDAVNSYKLVYTAPIRDEDSAGSFKRMLKFISMGWRIDTDNMAKVLARLDADPGSEHELEQTAVYRDKLIKVRAGY